MITDDFFYGSPFDEEYDDLFAGDLWVGEGSGLDFVLGDMNFDDQDDDDETAEATDEADQGAKSSNAALFLFLSSFEM